MKYLRFFERLMVAVTLLLLNLLLGDLLLTLDVRQARFETKVTQALNALGFGLTSQVHTELAPLSLQATGLLSDLRGKVGAVDIAALNSAVTAAGGTATALTAAAKPLAGSAEQIAAALPDFLDCQQTETGVGNKGCLYYRYSDLSRSADITLQAIAGAAPEVTKSVRTTSAAIADAAPALAGSAAGIAQSADRIGQTVDRTLADLTKPKTLRQRIESWLKFGVYAASRFI
jgi:hypothetical protein